MCVITFRVKILTPFKNDGHLNKCIFFIIVSAVHKQTECLLFYCFFIYPEDYCYLAIAPLTMAHFRATSLQQQTWVVAGNYYILCVTRKQMIWPISPRFGICFTFDIEKVLSTTVKFGFKHTPLLTYSMCHRFITQNLYKTPISQVLSSFGDIRQWSYGSTAETTIVFIS